MLSILLILFVTLCFIFERFLRKDDEANISFEKIPGPKGLPYFGNVEDLFCKPEERWKRTRSRGKQYYPIYKMKVAGRRMVFLLDPNDVEAILNNPKYMNKGKLYAPVRYWLGDGLLSSTGEIWRKGRKFFTKSFHFDALKIYINSFNGASSYLTKLLEQESEKPVEILNYSSFLSFRVACDTLFGKRIDIEDKAATKFPKVIKDLTAIAVLKMTVPLMNILYLYTDMKKREDEALKDFRDYTSSIIEECKENIEKENQPRFINTLLKNFEGEHMRNELDNFLFAGQDTTAIALSFIIFILGDKKQCQDEIYNEMVQTCGTNEPTYAEINQMNYLDRFIKECFRMYPTASFIGRTLEFEFTTSTGYTIPVGTNIFIQIFDIHRNSKIYPNPDIFDPDRFLPENILKRHTYSFLPFSAGPRNCIAQKFAVLFIKATLCGILKKYKIEAVGSIEDIVLVPDLLLKPKNPLEVKFSSRLLS